ncbi:MAG: transposase [Pseudonocardiaceae bacterium]
MATATGKDATVPAPHPLEFRRRAVELAHLGEQPIAALAKQLSISESCLRNWLAQADADDAADGSRLTTGEKKELAALRRDKRRLEMENNVLKRACAPNSSSTHSAWRSSDAAPPACHHHALRPRHTIHIMGIRTTPPRRRTAPVHGHDPRLPRQLNDGIVLGHPTTRSPRLPNLGNTR